ncbi:EamA/RhaT family transporter [Prosthecomicrobium hirschii]|uniref:DMT family transporter n=1 Tax=Prosthecodimorpha hirschii TaxID=665126 RepID=UPI00112B7D0B|nr:DMT family transporter [Prosthecomicrobium hirschii]TPQ45551.1 EamA/RhaT family transporter [Prosthecomicrobium hirschii]
MTDIPIETAPPRARYLAGALYGLGAIAIWSSWMAITRLGITTTLTTLDIVMLRFVTAGIILAPVLVKRGLAVDRLGWPRIAIFVVCAGAPYGVLAAGGLRFASVAHGGILIPGVMPLFVALLSALLFRERFSVARKTGYGLILVGILVIAGLTALTPGETKTIGHLLFLSAAFVWACYTVALRGISIDPLHAAAIISVGSAILFLPFYLAIHGFAPLGASTGELVFQAIFQGVVATILSLVLFAKAVSILGPSSGAAFGALVPAVSTLLAIPILGEIPAPLDWFGILAVTLGVYLASGGPLPRLRR